MNDPGLASDFLSLSITRSFPTFGATLMSNDQIRGVNVEKIQFVTRLVTGDSRMTRPEMLGIYSRPCMNAQRRCGSRFGLETHR